MTRWAGLVLAALTSSACAADPPALPPTNGSFAAEPPAPPPPARPASTARTLLRVDALLAAIARARDLPVRQRVPGVALSRPELLGRVREHITREVPREAVLAEGLVQKLLGLFPTDVDYEATTYALLTSKLAGYYEPADHTLYVADDLDATTGESTVSHELVHALQDQRWDLARSSRYRPGDDDASAALSALAEGDATSATEDAPTGVTEPGLGSLGEPDSAFRARSLADFESDRSRAPHSLRMALLAPYVEGTLFVRALRREGGWARVDEAWDSPPTTTEQVLHPDKWRAHEAALRVPDPRGPSAAPNLSLAEANTYGELGLRLAFAEWMGEGAASIAAAGWGGDRTALFTSGDGEAAFAWHITFDEAAPLPMTAFAVRAFDALARALGPSHRIPPRATQSLCIERPGNGALVLARAERDLFVVVGSTETGAHAWAPKMSCKETVAWAEELRSSRGPSAPLLH